MSNRQAQKMCQIDKCETKKQKPGKETFEHRELTQGPGLAYHLKCFGEQTTNGLEILGKKVEIL